MGDRRYRQRGYMDDARDERPRSRPGGPPPQREGPRGRGLGAPTESRFQCARCAREVPVAGAPALDATCRGCGADLHTCTNCRSFDPSARFECRRDIPQPIPKKATRNDCDLFEPREIKVFGSDAGRPSDPKAAFDKLFDF